MNTIILSIKPEYVEKIKTQEKKNEYRSIIPKKIPKFILVYETIPVGKINYLLEVDKPKELDDIKSYNKYKYAYLIRHMYKLEVGLKLSTLKEQYKFNPPQSFAYIDKYPELKEYIENNKLEKIF